MTTGTDDRPRDDRDARGLCVRFTANVLNEVRDMTFVQVMQHTAASFTVRTFGHLHRLGRALSFAAR
ncbi:hypothetical protein WS87_28340 [Burkholderia sp. MSMB0856]|uniref:hypothetical protein n=1 Tax=Burkholderia sp. MSMB0856 TaxID=1637869 RepID=UPI00075AB766|nr:hypothetical protein [Burkholderia sp. MSMB0856]AOJ90696.1 hypothetical protein WS87_28340 [Burkholderia sp. MSMB0856]KVH38309.1 hypothetical protein WS87_08650 [Burkholderia sp. MSMB0856]